MEDQLDIYTKMRQLGEERINRLCEDAVRFNRVSRSIGGSQLVSNMAADVQAGLEEWVSQKRGKRSQARLEVGSIVRSMGSAKVAALSCRIVVDYLVSGEASVLGLSRVLGRALEDEHRAASICALSPKQYKLFRNYFAKKGIRCKKSQQILGAIINRIPADKRVGLKEWSAEATVALSNLMVHLVVKTTGVVTIVKKRLSVNKTARILKISDDSQEFINRAVEIAKKIRPTHLALLEPPRDWVDPLVGGFSDKFVGRRPLISGRSKKPTRTLMDAECPDVYKAVNALQKTAWEFNQRVVAVLEVALKHHWSFPSLKMPEKVQDKPDRRPEGAEFGTDAYRFWAQSVRHLNFRKADSLAKTMKLSRLLHCSDLYGTRKFYYVHMLDFRGRAYPLASSMSYQGPDVFKGCLQFAEGQPVDSPEAEEWLHIHGANCYGLDKKTMAERVAWVKENRRDIIDVARDPLDNKMWVHADEPWQFLAWCFDVAGYWANPGTYLSKIPVGMDGSTNGLQLYALALRDKGLADKTNCTPSDTRKDIYADVAREVTTRLHNPPATDSVEQLGWGRAFMGFWKELPRAAAKKPVMTLPYGLTKYGCQHALWTWYVSEVRFHRLKNPPFPNGDSYKAMLWLGGILWETIESHVGGAMRAMEWVQSLANLCAHNDTPICWTSPSGFPVVQDYTRGSLLEVKMTLGRKVSVYYRDADKGPDVRRETKGAAPNWVHSLDAALLTRVVCRMADVGVRDLHMIHDCYGTHARNAPLLAKAVREEAFKMFSEYPMRDLLSQVRKLVGPEFVLPEPPAMGSLDLREVLSSTYFFS